MKNAHAPTTIKTRPRVETFFKEDGKFYFHFNDPDGEAFFFSRGYASAEDRDAGVEATMALLAGEAPVDLKKSKNGRFYFALHSDEQMEMGRSRLFATRKEMEKQLAAFRKAESGAIPPAAVPVETDAGPEPQAEPVKALPAAQSVERPKDAETMTRYKFSVIYYPNSTAWVVKNDFSGESRQMSSCDGRQIEEFLRAQLPAVAPVKSAAARPAPGRVQLNIKTVLGTVIERQAPKNELLRIEAIPESIQPEVFDAKVSARSLDDDRTVVIGSVSNQIPADRCFSIPLYGVQNLKPGHYLIITRIYQGKTAAQPVEFYGSHLVELN